MLDYKMGLVCDHQIIDEVLTVDGNTPSYYANIQYVFNEETSLIQLREFSATDGMTNYSYTQHGITNWELASSRQISFNVDGISGVASMVDGSTHINPAKEYLLSYATTLANCPKCLGTSTMYDVGFDGLGKIKEVTGREKLRQQVRKILLTKFGNNEFYETYGAKLQNLIGSKFNVRAQIMIQEYIRQALSELKSIQANEPDLPLSEMLIGIHKLEVERDSVEIRQANVSLTVTNGEYEDIKTGIRFTL